MLNLIRMEQVRIFKSKSSRFIFLGIILSFALTIGLVHYTTKNMDSLPREGYQDQAVENPNGINVNIDQEKIDQFDESGEDFVISSFSQTTYLIFLIIFGSLFFTSPYSHGFVKNFLGMTKNKNSYIFSTYLVASFYVIVTFIVGAIIMTLASPYINDGMFVFTNYSRMAKILFVELVSHLSYLSFILLIASLTRSTAITLMITFLYPTIFFNFLSGIATNLLGLFVKLPEDFMVADYVNIGGIISKTFTSTNFELTRSFLTSIFCYNKEKRYLERKI